MYLQSHRNFVFVVVLLKRVRNFIPWPRNGEGNPMSHSFSQILGNQESVKGRWRSRQVWGSFPRKYGEFLRFQGKHTHFQNMLGTCLALHHMSHFNVKSPPLGATFSMLIKKSLSKVCLGKGLRCHLGFFQGKPVSLWWFLGSLSNSCHWFSQASPGISAFS